MTELNVAVLGGGSWGTTVAALVTRNAPVTLWARNPATVAEINTRHTNEVYLPGATLPDKLVATNDIGEAVHGADVIVMGIPSQNFREVLLEVKKHIRAWVPVISLTKGLELDTSMRMTQIINEVLPGHPGRRAHRAQPGARDHGRAGGGQRDRHGRRDHRAGAADNVQKRPVPDLHQHRCDRL